MKRIAPLAACLMAAALLAQSAHASLFKGEALDNLADAIAWGALVIVPITLIIVFWLVHILPEKIAEKKKHPQAKAIQVLCLLSLAFGGLLWPLAWLWAYSKPVLHKMAYGTDVHETEHGASQESANDASLSATDAELQSLRLRVFDLEDAAAARAGTEARRV